MTIDELFEQLKTYPRDAHVTGFIDHSGGERKLGILVLWQVGEHVRTNFIRTDLLSRAISPAPPKKAT